MTSIYKLKQSEYYKGSLMAFENFESLMQIAEKAGEIDNYGAASSLCILAIEELTKSVVLRLKSINNSIPVKDLDKYFWNHEIKHNVGLELYFKIISTFENNDKLTYHKDSKWHLIIVVVLISIIILLYIEQKDKNTKNKKDESSFDSIKKSGFYVDYDMDTKQWKSPKNEHSRESYNDLFELSMDFAEMVKKWIFNNNLNKESIIDFALNLDDNIFDKKQLRILKNK